MSYCTDHPQYQISAICIATHQGSRKLCSMCLNNIGLTNKQSIPINIFVEKLNEKFNQYKLWEKSKQNQIRIAFQYLLASTEEMIKNLCKQLNESIKEVLDRIQEQDEQYINLFAANQNPTESSNNDLEKLVQILEENTLEVWNTQKNQYLLKLEQSKHWLDQETKNFSKSLKNEMAEILTFFENSKQEKYIWKDLTYQQNSFIWDYLKDRFIKTKFNVTFTKQQEIKYIRDGQILRNDKIRDSSNTEVLKNLEQIEFLNWVGCYGKSNQKVGKWIATWKGQTLNNVGGYYTQILDIKMVNGRSQTKIIGVKQRLMKLENLQMDREEEIGNIFMERKKCIQNEYFLKSGRGHYNQQGQKNGKCVEITDMFWDQSQTIYSGEYKNGKKVGRWDILFKGEEEENFEQIGGGSYDEEGNELKIGRWIELPNSLQCDVQVTYDGEYKNGKKFGRWDCLYQKDQIGGGSYDEEGNGNKSGKWIELKEGFDNWKQITSIGEYKNGKKVSRWDIQWNWEGENKQIGGGSYDEGGNEIKIGKWIELSEGFSNTSQIIFTGDYKNDKKVARWDILYRQEGENEFKQIGGGLYDEEGNGVKIGNWIEQNDGFWTDSQVTYNGEYKNGLKVGRWDTLYNGEQIGGGQYDERENGIKIGKWIDLSYGYKYNSQVTYKGGYKDGVKIDKWEIFDENNLIGGGAYDEEGDGIKIGKWIELQNKFDCYNQITYTGEYVNGKKVGIWVEQGQSNWENIQKELKYDI